MLSEAKVREALDRIRSRDRDLGGELDAKLKAGAQTEGRGTRILREGFGGAEAAPARPLLTRETIVLATGRPVLAISGNEAQLKFVDAESEVWRERLQRAGALLTNVIKAVGRIDVDHHPNLDWVGTGWLLRPDVIVTNRHVAREFGRRNGEGFVFRGGVGQKMSASVDFLKEAGRADQSVFRVREIIHIEDDDGPDIAFLRVEGSGLAAPVTLSSTSPKEARFACVIGYPARDSRIPDQDLMERIFGDVYDKKRLAPGQITAVASDLLQHDCSTLGGNSGSVVLDLASGEAVGIHFAGRFLEANFAAPAEQILERLSRIDRGDKPRRGMERDLHLQSTAAGDGVSSITCTIPIRITVEVGSSYSGEPCITSVSAGRRQPALRRAADEGDEDVILTEGVPEDYRDRRGYRPDFLGQDTDIPLPAIARGDDQIVTFTFAGNPQETELRYQHFSVKMHRERRLCFFSAVNIAGAKSRKVKRPGWRRDPRIPNELQILGECYGDAPRFCRGHMTRREDPVWGDEHEAAQGNADSMHVTNTVPQMQTFNAGIWLGLEDYALDHARDDEMRISVFTGPVLLDRDPVRYGVKIPRTFWKVIAFIHEKTGKLSATGYSISQEKFLMEEEFVFGAYETHQRSLSWIEQKAGISFGNLTAVDRFQDSEEAVEAPLANLRQIRFF